MPGRLFLSTPPEALALLLGADSTAVSGEPPRLNIAPGQDILVCDPALKLRRMRWGLIPVGRVNARGRPVMETIVNARSETVFAKSAFQGVRRAVVPADGWYEWTGPPRRKTAWRIALKSGRPLLFAAIWDEWTAPGGRVLPQVATVTCPPNDDVRGIHDRMGVILDPRDLPGWLEGTEEEAAGLMVPLADGRLDIGPAAGVDWSGP